MTVTVTDKQDENAEQDLTIDDQIEVTITVDNVNESPSVDGPVHVQFPEGGRVFVGLYTANDPDHMDMIGWDLLGADANVFEIDSSGNLSFESVPDYDTPRSDTYHVSVRATDGGNLQGVMNVRIDITEVDEPPLISGPDSVDHDENTTGTVATLSAADPERAAVSWSLGDAGWRLLRHQ